MTTTVGEMVDSLGVTVRIADDDMLTDVVILAKIVEADGGVRLSIGWSEGMSWIERLGMLTAGMQTDSLSPGSTEPDGDDDE